MHTHCRLGAPAMPAVSDSVASGVGAVIAASLQVEEQAGDDVVGVPAVHRGAALVAAVMLFLP